MMSRRTVQQIFVWTLVGMIAGLVVSVTALIALVANHAFIMDGPDVVGFRATPFTWTMVGIGVAGVLLVIGGAIGQFVAWIGALVRTVGRLTRPGSSSCWSPDCSVRVWSA